MNIGPFFNSDPIGLTLAYDAFFGESPQDLDIVWQLRFDAQSPLSLSSTLGLQAQSFQLFPQFSLNKVLRSQVSEFFAAPRLQIIYSNFARFVLTPFEDIDAVVDLWVKDGNLLLGRVRLLNHSDRTLEVGTRLAANLVSLHGNSNLKHTRQGYQTYLKGVSGNLSVNLTMEGMAKTVLSPNPSLEQSKQLTAGQSFDVFWQADIRQNTEQEHPKQILNFPLNWDAEVARIEVANQSRLIQVHTPHSDWDTVFFSNQNQAFQLIRGYRSEALVIEKSRSVHSVKTISAAGLPPKHQVHPIELWQLLNSLMPAQTSLAAELFANQLVLSLQQCQPTSQQAPPFPCLVQLAWRIHQVYQQKDYLQAIFPALLQLVECWFNLKNDRDQDGMPEWQDLEQMGLETLRLFSLSDEASSPTKLNFTESFGLAAMLGDELDALQKIAAILEKTEALTLLQSRSSRLKAWMDQHASYQNQSNYLDYENHAPHRGQTVFDGPLGEFGNRSHYLTTPARINLRLKPPLLLKKPAPFSIHGTDKDGGLVEELVSASDLLWLPGSFFLTTRNAFSRVDRIEGLDLGNTQLSIHVADLFFFDISWLFGKPMEKVESGQSPDATSSILDQWLAATAYGLPEALTSSLEGHSVNLGWNCLLVADLIERDERQLAFKLFSQLMSAQVALFKNDHANSERWSALSARGQGTKNALGGLLPIDLFLELAGITIYHENKVRVHGPNPFPWQVKVQYRGLEVTRDGKNASVRFPNGEIEHHFGSSMKTFSRATDSEPKS